MSKRRGNVIVIDALTSNIRSVISKNITRCSSSVNAKTGINLVGSGNTVEDVDLEQKVDFDMECFTSTSNKSRLVENVSNEIVSTIEQQHQGVISALGRGRTETIQNIRNEVEEVFTSEDTLECISDIVADNTINITGDNNTFRRIKSSQAVSGISKCIMNRLHEMDTISEVVNNAQAKLDQEAAQLEFANLFGDLAGGMTSIVITVIVIGAIFTFFLFYLIVQGIKWLFT